MKKKNEDLPILTGKVIEAAFQLVVCCVTSGLNLNVTVLVGDCRLF